MHIRPNTGERDELPNFVNTVAIEVYIVQLPMAHFWRELKFPTSFNCLLFLASAHTSLLLEQKWECVVWEKS